MATETTVSILDDIDGTPGAITTRFSIGDVQYEIDLSNENYEKMLQALDPYRKVARITESSPSKKARTNNAPVLSAEDRDKIRAWAIVNNRHCPSRGRFPNGLVRDYYADMLRNPKELLFVK